jgi:hypothetical protein
MKRLIFVVLIFLPSLSLAQNGTFNSSLPDASLIYYSGDQSILASVSSVDFRRRISVSNTADCGAGGAQGTPANPFAFFAGGRLVWSGANGYPIDPTTGRVVLQCLPLEVDMGASWGSRRQDQVNDHLYQANIVTAIGGLPGSTQTALQVTEACSLIGYAGLGTPFVTSDTTGECEYYGAGMGPVPMNGGTPN